MGFYRGPQIVTSGLVLHLDAGNPKSYPGTGSTWYDRSGNLNGGVVNNGTLVNDLVLVLLIWEVLDLMV